MVDEMIYQVLKMRLRFCQWVAWHMPREIVKWCFIRLAAKATTGEYAGKDTTIVTCLEALSCWDIKK